VSKYSSASAIDLIYARKTNELLTNPLADRSNPIGYFFAPLFRVDPLDHLRRFSRNEGARYTGSTTTMSAASTDTTPSGSSEPHCALDLTEPFALGDWRIDPALRTASCGDTVVKIDPRNLRVLQILVERHGQVVSQRELESLAWEGVVVTPDSLYQSIRQLRQALQDTKAPAKYIETVPRRGYRMVAGPLALPPQALLVQCPASESETRGSIRFDSPFPQNAAFRRALLPTFLAGIVAVLAALAWLATPRSFDANASRASEASSKAVRDASSPTGQIDASSNTSFRMLRALGYDALRRGSPREAVEHFEQALQRQVADAGERNQFVMEVLVEIANAYMWLDEEARAYETAARALSIADQLGPTSNPERIVALVKVGEALVALGDYARADPLITDAVARARQYFGEDNALVSTPLVAFAQLRLAQGRLSEAEKVAREAVANLTRDRGGQDIHTAHARSLFCAILIEQGRGNEAEREARAVIDAANRNVTNEPHPYEISATHLLAEALLDQGEYSRAEALLHKELAALRAMEATDWRIARAASVLGEVYLRKGRLTDAQGQLLLAKSKLTRTKGWPIEREVRNLARRLGELDALRAERVSAVEN
jgi:DNA-binding winged helix-turn-helix (wHTH) protein